MHYYMASNSQTKRSTRFFLVRAALGPYCHDLGPILIFPRTDLAFGQEKVNIAFLEEK